MEFEPEPDAEEGQHTPFSTRSALELALRSFSALRPSSAPPMSELLSELQDSLNTAQTVLETVKEFGLEEYLCEGNNGLEFDSLSFISRLDELTSKCGEIQFANGWQAVKDLKKVYSQLQQGFSGLRKFHGNDVFRLGDPEEVEKRLRALGKLLNASTRDAKAAEDRFAPLCSQCQSIFTRDHLVEDPWFEFSLQPNAPTSACALCRQLVHRSILTEHEKTRREAIQIQYRIALHPAYWRNCYVLRFRRVEYEGDQRRTVTFSIVGPLGDGEHNEDIDVPLPVLLEPTTSSKKSKRQAAEWILRCRNEHTKCQMIERTPKTVPKRLLFIDRASKNMKVRLCETRRMKNKPQYFALSHCWGKALVARLTTKNYNAWLKIIPLDILPQVFRDTFEVAGRSGINHVWIDSLCIVQDSEADWRREAATMGFVYRNSFCNVAATGFLNGDNGLFVHRDNDVLQPIGIELSAAVQLDVSDISVNGGGEGLVPGRYMLYDLETWGHGVHAAPLNLRGWVVQERHLSVRTLHFGAEQLFWECHGLQACEVWPSGFPHEVPAGTVKMHKDLEDTAFSERYVEGVFVRLSNGASSRVAEESPEDFEATKPPGLDTQNHMSEQKSAYEGERRNVKWRHLEFSGDYSAWGKPNRHSAWDSVVHAFSGCNLTFPSDKLIAIAGLARMIQPAMRCRYHAGMWEDNLIHQLAWKVILGRKERPVAMGRGPSWSWASVDGEVDKPYWDANPMIDPTILLASVISASSELTDGDEFGFVNGGRLRLLASLASLRICKPFTAEKELEEGEDALSIFWDTTEEDQIYGEAKDQRRDRSPRHATPNTVVRKLNTCSLTDDKDNSTKRDVFFAPIRMMGEDPDVSYDITLIGLLLRPTGQGRGEFRRIGQFETYQEQFRGTEIVQMFQRLKRSSTQLDEAFFLECDGAGQFVFEIV